LCLKNGGGIMLYTELKYQWNQPQQIENDERIIFGGFGFPDMGMGIEKVS
jgi:hypothetical protein